MKSENSKYSPLIEGLRSAFESRADSGDRYLLVYWQGWGKTTAFVGTKPGAWPWAAHDEYMAQENSGSILAFAFDLSRGFDEQIPEEVRGYEKLEAFAFQPLIHIPDRTGKVPAARDQEAIAKMLRPAPALRLVK